MKEDAIDAEGTVTGGAIRLGDSLAGLEGKRVRVHVEVIDDDGPLPRAEARSHWDAWVAGGPQGPLDDDDDSWT